jgi:hypothetical protein
MELDHLSYSSITMFLDCPEAWRRKYVLQETTRSTPALAFGSAFHGAIEAQLRGEDSAVSAWAGAWSKALERETVDFGLDTPEQHFNEGVRLLSHAKVQDTLKGLTARRDEEGVMVERKVELRVPGVKVPIIGYIDFIASDGVPCDLKTSARSWSADKASDSLQSLFYLAAMNQAGQHYHNWRFRHVVFVKTKEPNVQVIEHTHTPGEVFFLFSLIRKVWEAIAVSAFYPNPTGWRCSPQYCDFYGRCRGRYA